MTKLEERCVQLDAILSASEKARLVVGVRSIVQSVVTDKAKRFKSSFKIVKGTRCVWATSNAKFSDAI